MVLEGSVSADLSWPEFLMCRFQINGFLCKTHFPSTYFLA